MGLASVNDGGYILEEGHIIPIESFKQKNKLAASKYAYDVIKVKVKDRIEEPEREQNATMNGLVTADLLGTRNNKSYPLAGTSQNGKLHSLETIKPATACSYL